MARTRQGYIKLQLSLPENIVKSLKVAAAQRGLGLSDYVLERIAGNAANPVHVHGDFVIAPAAVPAAAQVVIDPLTVVDDDLESHGP